MKIRVKKLRELIREVLLSESTCTSCGSTGAYIGLNDIECPNPSCKYFSQKQQASKASNGPEKTFVKGQKGCLACNGKLTDYPDERVPGDDKMCTGCGEIWSPGDQIDSSIPSTQKSQVNDDPEVGMMYDDGTGRIFRLSRIKHLLSPQEESDIRAGKRLKKSIANSRGGKPDSVVEFELAE